MATSSTTAIDQDRAELRRDILDRVEGLRDLVESRAADGEELGTLPDEVWRAIDAAGLFRIKVPVELGGMDADAQIQIEAIERMSYFDGSAGWTLMVGLGAAAMAAGWASDRALEEVVLDGDRVRRGAALLAPTGKAVPADGGYRLSGRWSFGSGNRHAEWISLTALVDGETPPVRTFIVDATKVERHDNWNVIGLQATGSSDVSVSDLFVPVDHLLAPGLQPPLRGGPVLRMGQPGLVACEHAAFALGVGRRMIDEITVLAETKARGIMAKRAIANNQHFQSDLGSADLKLRVIRSYVLNAYAEAHGVVVDGGQLSQAEQLNLRLAAVQATDVALEVADVLVRYAGTTGIYRGSFIERCWRNIHAGAQHHMISPLTYEAQGRQLLGFDGINALD